MGDHHYDSPKFKKNKVLELIWCYWMAGSAVLLCKTIFNIYSLLIRQTVWKVSRFLKKNSAWLFYLMYNVTIWERLKILLQKVSYHMFTSYNIQNHTTEKLCKARKLISLRWYNHPHTPVDLNTSATFLYKTSLLRSKSFKTFQKNSGPFNQPFYKNKQKKKIRTSRTSSDEHQNIIFVKEFSRVTVASIDVLRSLELCNISNSLTQVTLEYLNNPVHLSNLSK